MTKQYSWILKTAAMFACFDPYKFILWGWILGTICRYVSCESIDISLVCSELPSSSFEMFREGAAKGCFPGVVVRTVYMRVPSCLCYDSVFETCIYISTTGCSTNLPEVASHHHPRSGWGEYTGQQRLDCSLTYYIHVHIILIHSCIGEHGIP
jgi:hypothetical protein